PQQAARSLAAAQRHHGGRPRQHAHRGYHSGPKRPASRHHKVGNQVHKETSSYLSSCFLVYYHPMPNIFFLYGNDEFAISRKLKDFESDFSDPTSADMNTARFEARSVSDD